ncbi:MAG: ATP-binding protein [Myxococcota bacterium]
MFDADTAPVGLVSFDDHAVVRECNRTLLTWLGHAPEAVVGGRLDALLTVAGRLFFQTHVFPLLKMQGAVEELAFSLRAADGTPCPVLVSGARVPGATTRFTLACLRVPNRQRYEDEIVNARREAERALHSNEALAAARDEAETHALELDRQLRRSRAQSRELARVGTVLSHHLREPIRKTRVFVDLVRDAARTAEATETLDAMERAVERMDVLVGVLRDFLQESEEERVFAPVPLEEPVRHAVARVRERYGAAPEVHVGALPEVRGDADALARLFEHLLDNSVKFARKGERPLVRIAARTARENVFGALPGRYRYVTFACVTYEDNSEGFDPRFADQVFDLMPRIRASSTGLGYGLALCRRIAEAHGGDIRVLSSGEGETRFEIRLPIAADDRKE